MGIQQHIQSDVASRVAKEASLGLVGLDTGSFGSNFVGTSQSRGFRSFLRSIERDIRHKQRKNKLVPLLAASSYPGARKEAHKIRKCFCKLLSTGTTGGISYLANTCKSRWCPTCADKKNRLKIGYLDRALRNIRLAYGKRINLLAVTLTQDPKKMAAAKYEGTQARMNLLALGKRFKRLQQTAWWRSNIEGSWITKEIAKKTSYWNMHGHLIIATYLDQATATNELKAVWGKLFGGHIKVKKFREDRNGRALSSEWVKYIIKELTLSADDLGEAVAAAHNVRMSSATGIIRTQIQAIKDREKDEEKHARKVKPPEPPKAYDEDTGEVYKIPRGAYEADDLLTRAIVSKGSARKAWLWALRYMAYRQRWGRAWEEWLEKNNMDVATNKARIGYFPNALDCKVAAALSELM